MLSWQEYIEAEDVRDRREYGRMSSGISVFRQGRALILLPPNDSFRALSTDFHKGGYVSAPEAIVDVSTMGGLTEIGCLSGGIDVCDYADTIYLNKLGLDERRSMVFDTAANMDNAVVWSRTTMDGVKVSVAVTGGITHNAGRAGDPAVYDETEGSVRDNGTIIIMLAIDANLSDSALFEAMLIATEAKSCLIQELQARSINSHCIATGSGTDQVAVICNKASAHSYNKIGRDSELAKMIAASLHKAIAEAMDKQTGMNPVTQSDIYELLFHFGITKDSLQSEVRSSSAMLSVTMADWMSAYEALGKDREAFALVSSLAHISDTIDGGLVPKEDGMVMMRKIVSSLYLGPIEDNLWQMELDSAADAKELISYATALKILQMVKSRRKGNVQ